MNRISNSWTRHRLFLRMIAALVALLIALLAAAAAPDQATRNTFNTSCASCHGQGGKGDTAIGKSLHVPDLSSAATKAQSDAQLRQVIVDGRGNMPPFKSSLTAAQIDSLVAYIRTLSKANRKS